MAEQPLPPKSAQAGRDEELALLARLWQCVPEPQGPCKSPSTLLSGTADTLVPGFKPPSSASIPRPPSGTYPALPVSITPASGIAALTDQLSAVKHIPPKQLPAE